MRNVKLRKAILSIIQEKGPLTSAQILDIMPKNRFTPSTTKIGALCSIIPETEKVGDKEPYMWRIKKCYGQKNTDRER